MTRDGFMCPECGYIKDAFDRERNASRDTAWCWNLDAHESGSRRKMESAELFVRDGGREVPTDLHAWFGVPEYCAIGIAAHVHWDRQTSWGVDAVEFVRRNPEATWGWMHVPANGDWHSLKVRAKIHGVVVEFSGGGGWTAREANLLTAHMREARVLEESGTPSPFAYAEYGT